MIKPLYERFDGKDLEVAEKIQHRRLQILIHSCLYYEMNSNIIPDQKFDKWAHELADLQQRYPNIAREVRYAEDFEGFDGSTGMDLPIHEPEIVERAERLLIIESKKKPSKEQAKKKRRLF